MKFFAKRGLFEKSGHLEPNWYEDEEIASKVKEVMTKADLSLYDLMRLRPREAEKLCTNTDFCRFILPSAKSFQRWKQLPVESREACAMHLCDKMSRRFFRDWALDSFLELIHYRLPILCCEMIIDNLTNQDLCNICLAAPGQSSIQHAKKYTRGSTGRCGAVAAAAQYRQRCTEGLLFVSSQLPCSSGRLLRCGWHALLALVLAMALLCQRSDATMCDASCSLLCGVACYTAATGLGLAVPGLAIVAAAPTIAAFVQCMTVCVHVD
ncbi:unnamed protein product [Trichogramma brassicae]|uniref:Uncharacterized protein n=1 Tax=Trichogramma brassicae TaxID=86971 RepID=A0A6H5J5M8_9HYME|nr:unnamed protein product [Trichogramma brassicae]